MTLANYVSDYASPAETKAKKVEKFGVVTVLMWMVTGLAGIAGILVSYRVYQQENAWLYGLDATSLEFEQVWMVLLKVQLPILFGLCLAMFAYLILTRDRNVMEVSPQVELKRYFTLTAWLVAYTFAVYFTGSFFAEHDGVWHQVVLRDTPFSPSHIVLFYACIPIYLFFGVSSFLYAMTRIPAFARGISLMHVFAVAGPFLILPNLGYNEWGHAYWLTEEIFSHPLHWGFVVLGWNGLALAGVLMQIVGRMQVLFPIVFADEQKTIASGA
jgi:methane/ammonia monooxygenase subunit C